MELFVYVLNGLEAGAFITGFACWGKLRKSYWRFFPIYLAGIFACEMAGKLMKFQHYWAANRAFYNYFVTKVEFVFFYWLFYRSFMRSRNKRLALGCIGLYIAGFVGDVLYVHHFEYWFSSFTYSLGVALMLGLIALYFVELVTSDEAILHVRKNMLFWVCNGLLFFYIGTFPYYGLRNTFWVKHADLYELYSYFAYALNWFMYLMFTAGFIWGKPTT